MKGDLRLLRLQRRLAVVVLCLVLFALVCLVGYYFADILRILGISIFLTYMVISIVDLIEKWLKKRVLAVIVVYTALLAGLIVGVLLIVPAILVQVSQLIETTVDAIPQLVEHMTQAVSPLVQRFRAHQIDIKEVDIIQTVVSNIPRPDPSALMSRITDVAMSTLLWVLYWISISVVTFYFLLDGPKITDSLIRLFPKSQQEFLRGCAQDSDRGLQSFFRGQINLGLAFGLVMLVVYFVLGVQYSLLLGIFLGVMEIIPVIGPPIGFLPAVLAVAFHGSALPGNKFVQILLLFMIFTILQNLKDNIVAPRYIGNVIGLHPILICLAIMIGARLDGTFGIIFALPLACIVSATINRSRTLWTEPRNPGDTRDTQLQPEGEPPPSGSPSIETE